MKNTGINPVVIKEIRQRDRNEHCKEKSSEYSARTGCYMFPELFSAPACAKILPK